VLVGDLLHVAGRDPVLQTVDLTLERVVGTLDAPDGTTDFGIGISAAAGLVFVGSGAILVADVSPPTAPRWLGQLAPHSGDPFYTQAMGDRLIVSNGNRLDVIALDCR
jgi:hypothetical protein